MCGGHEVLVLVDAIDEFDRRLSRFDEAQSSVELLINEEDLAQDITNSSDFRNSCKEFRLKAASLLKRIEGNTNFKNSTVASSDHANYVTLPKIELPHFKGDVLNWQSFWEQFSVTVDNSDLPDVQKFSYLKSLLEGDARQCIEGLSLNAEHYKTACVILKERFGREDKIIFCHVQELLNLSVPASVKCDVSQMWKFYNDLLKHMRSLEALGITGSQYGVILTPVVLSRLPSDLRMEWALDSVKRENDLTFLLQFIKNEIERRERSQVYKEMSPCVKNSEQQLPSKISCAAALPSMSSTCITSCAVCNKKHQTSRCLDLTRRPLDERKRKISAAGLCFRCLKKNHLAKHCSSVCSKCHGRHHVLLCNNNDKNSNEISVNANASENVVKQERVENSKTENNTVSHSTSAVSNSQNDVKKCYRVRLQTARTSARGKQGVTDVNILFDTGSDRSYVSSSLVKKIQPEFVETVNLSYAAFGTSSSSANSLHNVYEVLLSDSHGFEHPLLATEIPVVCAPMFRPKVPPELIESFGEIQFSDVYDVSAEVTIDVLIGLDNYWKFIKPQILCSEPSGFMAQSSLFGWVLYGSIASSEVNSDVATVVTSHQLLCFDRLSESHLHQVWNLECIGINDKDDKLSDNVLQNFSDNISFVDGRYKVSLPWKQHSKSKLLDNKKLALGRLKQLDRKLERDTKLKQTYNQNILDMCNAGIVEEVPPNELICFDPVFYMPHRPVVRESSLTTTVRPVFDCSAKGYNNVSLNDCLETGPSLLSNLTEILIRFRRWRVAIIADIEKAFLQIEVNEQDCNVHRFLWNHDNVTKVMRFRRVPFGNCSSPFLLNATLQHHLSVVPQTPLVKELKDNIYVDDLLTGTDSELDGCQFIKEATEIMSLTSFPLTKWGSNSQVVGELLQQSFKDKFVDADIIKVLGMNWLANQDCFSFSGVSGLDGLLITKRVVLSCIARLFDPLGFAAPFVMQAKCLFQELWKLGLSWDEEIPEQLCFVFSKWLDDLQLLRQWCIPRNYTGKGWCDIDHIELLGFGDASPKGYGACIYLKATINDGTCVCSLVIAKSRVAPLKELSLPRLELLGSLLCA